MIQHVLLVVNFIAIKLYSRNDSQLDMSDLHAWLSGQSVALCQREIYNGCYNEMITIWTITLWLNIPSKVAIK